MTLLLTPNNLFHILLSAFSLLLLHLLVKFTRRVYFHRLSHVPGPRLAAATFQYEAFHDVVRDGQFNWHLAELHDAYGPVVRCSPEEVHVRDSEYFDELHPGAGATAGSRTRARWERANRANNSPGSVASALGHEVHRRRRAVLNPYFSKAAVGRLETGCIRGKVEGLVDRIAGKIESEDSKSESKSRTATIDLGTAATALTLDVISEYCYDECYDCLEDEDFAPRWKRAMTDIFEPVGVMKHFPVVGRAMDLVPRWLVERMDPNLGLFLRIREDLTTRAGEIFREYMEGAKEKGREKERVNGDGQETKGEQEQEQEQENERPKTVYHGLLYGPAAKALPAEERTSARLADEAFVLLTAGAETTARVLTTIVAHLLLRQREEEVAEGLGRRGEKTLLSRLRDELAPVMPPSSGGESSRFPASSTLEQLPLVRAVVQEGLRMAEPVTNRQVLLAPGEELVCHGVRIPKNTPTSQTYRDVLLDEAVFAEPRRFLPERWLASWGKEEDGADADADADADTGEHDDGEERGRKDEKCKSKRLDRYQVAFSKGSRSCVGMNLAYTELYLTIAGLVSRFDMELTEDFDRERDLDVVRDKFIGLPSRQARPVRVKFRERFA